MLFFLSLTHLSLLLKEFLISRVVRHGLAYILGFAAEFRIAAIKKHIKLQYVDVIPCVIQTDQAIPIISRIIIQDIGNSFNNCVTHFFRVVREFIN